ncbi:MAG: NAD(P)-binding protein [Thermodesulfobacteriota bacterium]
MYKVAIVGAGVGGSYLAYLLSKRGIHTVVFDPRTPHEKLCGGGVTPKAIADFPLLLELPCPRHEIWKAVLISPNDTMTSVELEKPLTIFNRRDLDYTLLIKAQELGAYLRAERVNVFARVGSHWEISTDQAQYEAEIIVGADGAMSRTRKILGISTGGPECFLALACFIDMTGDSALFKFFPDFKGYLWAFPRVDKTVVGIVSRYSTAHDIATLKQMLRNYIELRFPSHLNHISFRGGLVPLFSNESLCGRQRICSENWALIGDAASLVDPISGEGIYYALCSADILAACIAENNLPLYHDLCMERIGRILGEAARCYPYLYRDGFIGTMVSLVDKSRTIRGVISEMMAGDINYVSYTWKFSRHLLGLLSMLGRHEKTH